MKISHVQVWTKLTRIFKKNIITQRQNSSEKLQIIALFQPKIYKITAKTL